MPRGGRFWMLEWRNRTKRIIHPCPHPWGRGGLGSWHSFWELRGKWPLFDYLDTPMFRYMPPYLWSSLAPRKTGSEDGRVKERSKRISRSILFLLFLYNGWSFRELKDSEFTHKHKWVWIGFGLSSCLNMTEIEDKDFTGF